MLTHRGSIAAGLAPKLESTGDSGRKQPAEFQAGVDLILKTLRESDCPVTVVAVGSLRDVAAAYNRDRELCARTARAARARQPAEGPEEYATAVAGLRPELQADLTALFGAYARLRYDGAASDQRVARFAAAVRRFRPARRPATQPA